jgi:hypothetical protein
MFSDRLAEAVNRFDVHDAAAVSKFRADTRLALETLLRFTHRYWFHQVSHQEQAQHLFNMCRRHLEVDPLYEDVREEVQDMSQYLEAEAVRRQNETMMRTDADRAFAVPLAPPICPGLAHTKSAAPAAGTSRTRCSDAPESRPDLP